jgi:agmatinase
VSEPRLNLPITGIASFCKAPVCMDPATLEADVAILGVPWDEGTGFRPGARFGPRGIREYSVRYAFGERGAAVGGYWDVEARRRYLEKLRLADCGDVDIIYTDWQRTFANITAAVRGLLDRGAFPVVLGGDNSITFPVVQAYAERGPFGLLHVDAHLDYSDEFLGVRIANGNPIKRISELPFVTRIIQVGIRGIRTRQDAFEDSSRRGNLIVTARELHESGVAAVLNKIPRLDRYYVTVDIDALDPAIAPGTSSPEPDGLTYRQLRDLLRGIAGKGRILGMDLVETNPFLDPIGLTQSLAASTILEFLAAIFG